MSKSHTPHAISKENNYIWLMIALLFLLFCSALSDQLGSDVLSRFMGVLLTLTILLAVWSFDRDTHPLYSRWMITLLLLGITFLEYYFEHQGWTIMQLTTILVFTAVTIAFACKQVLFSGDVDGNKIIGAICIYMFLAIGWAICYLLLEFIFPGSIPALELTTGDWRHNMQDAVYYSFVTITTLGFGDISPAQPLARYITYLEAVTGQFYIAVLVASLIGVRLAARMK